MYIKEFKSFSGVEAMLSCTAIKTPPPWRSLSLRYIVYCGGKISEFLMSSDSQVSVAKTMSGFSVSKNSLKAIHLSCDPND